MKDNSVAPTGLFSPHRQRRLIDALVQRFQVSEKQRQELLQRHAAEREREEQDLLSDRDSVTGECRRRRRDMLSQWDQEEEKLIGKYESDTIEMRHELSRLASRFRKKVAEGKSVVERKLEARRAAIIQQYEAHKHEPGEKSKKEHEQIASSLSPLVAELTEARNLTVSRLDGLPKVTKEESDEEPPATVQQALDSIFNLSRACHSHVAELHTGVSAKLIDSFFIYGFVLAMIAGWILIVVLLRPESFWIFLGSGIAGAFVIGLVVYAALLLPLRQKTKRIYPQIEQIGMRADDLAGTARKISTDLAKATAAEMVADRDKLLEAAEAWKVEQIESLEKRLEEERRAAKQELMDQLNSLGDEFLARQGRVNSEMHGQAEEVAAEITNELSQTDQSLHKQREANAKRRQEELTKVTDRMRDGVRAGLERISNVCSQAAQRFPSWEDVHKQPHCDHAELDYVPLGQLRIGEPLTRTLASKETVAATEQTIGHRPDIAPIFRSDEIPADMPIALHRRLHSGLIIHAAKGQADQATELVHQVLWRMLSGTAGGRTKLTLIDPIGRGQNFTSFMSLTDHDPALVGHRVWTTENQIEARLGEVAQHAEDVLQASLRDQFERVEDYNLIAGSMAEPYQAVAAIGFPEGLTRGGYKHLKALIESGVRCGVFVLMVVTDDQTWPSDLPMPKDHRLLELQLHDDGHWSLKHDGLNELEFEPAPNVPVDLRSELVEKIGTAVTEASRVEIPLESILTDHGGDGSTDDGVDILIGSQGGQRTLSLELGEGVRQHVLIAGKTGSGKSTLLHAIITSGAYQYTPDQLQYYLLDFKKGVEFKAYADGGLPHARVIGIESEREFGRSVLQRLDQELQHRGELFRSESAQELLEYRRSSGKEMPRIMLVIDEFQELFVRDDKVAADCAMLLDRLVRQGRSFGIHVILSSQSLAGAYSLPRATLGQMAVRIAMQCSESDAALILSDDNTAARLINRPGEAIYNDAGGLVEGNQPFQVAWLASDRHDELLKTVSKRDTDSVSHLPPPVVFEGNRPCKWTRSLASAAIGDDARANEEIHGLLGEAVEIGPPVGLQLSRNAGRNVLMIPPLEARTALLSSLLSGFAKSHPDLEVVYFNGNRASESQSMAPWMEQAGLNARTVGPREGEKEMIKLVEVVKERGDEAENVHPIVVVIDPVDRFRDFRHEDAYQFTLDSGPSAMSGGQAMREVLKDGPPANVFCVLVCGGAEIVSRWLPRQSQHDVELRVLGHLNASDSSLLIDSPVAAELSAATMLLYDEPAGRIAKFRQPDLPDADDVRRWLGK